MKQKPGGLSLERFAKAKQSGYDKKAKKAKELALNAKKVNKYRKLKQKLAAKGMLSPRYTYEQQVRRQGETARRTCSRQQRVLSESC